MMMLSEATQAMQGHLVGMDGYFGSVEIDTRRIQPEALYFAIHGERQNGHQFIGQAMQAKAVAAVVDESFASHATTCHIRVDDTTRALGQLAAHWRNKFDVPVVGITGSNGKTTVSQMLGTIFSEQIPGVTPQGSFNNHWGVPLTLLKLRDSDRSAVIEMGMNHAGELTCLGKIVRPTVVLITNAAAAHLEGLGSIEAVAKAKGELIDSVSEEGVVILNRDDAFYAQWRARAAEHAVISFGVHERADVKIVPSGDSALTLDIQGEIRTFKYALPGLHNQMNAAAAVAASIAVGLSLDTISDGLQRVKAVKGRLQVRHASADLMLIDDTYNANQASVQAAIALLASRPGQKILVLGGMGELGDASAQIHHQIGAFAKSSGIDVLFTLVDHSGDAYLEDMAQYLSGFGKNASAHSEVSDLVNAVARAVTSRSTVLIKGSRFARMERVSDALQCMEESKC